MPNAVELVKQTGHSEAQSACQEQLLQGGHRDEASDSQPLIPGQVNMLPVVVFQNRVWNLRRLIDVSGTGR